MRLARKPARVLFRRRFLVVSAASLLMLLAIGDGALAQTAGAAAKDAKNTPQLNGHGSSTKTAKSEPPSVPKPRGLLMDEGSYCDVSAPCPQGCSLDTASNRCIEQSQ
jgi:hypothetical protein